MVDRYLRRNWVYTNDILDPDANLFLGDLLDGGREWKDPQWLEEYERWNHIYTKLPNKPMITSVAGNHDIGFGNTIIPEAYDRFVKYFGEPSSTHVIGNHTFVLLDTISMMNTENSSVYQKPYDFMNKITQTDSFGQYPRILLSHVPLYRNPALNCGPNRESKNQLPYVRGYQYQTMIAPEVTDTILKTIEPVAIFAGDDHDACYVKHNFTANGGAEDKPLHAEEWTVKSVSMAMGVLKPAIQLLSLHNDGTEMDQPTFQTKICYMPSPFFGFILYFLFAGFTTTLVLIINFLPAILPARVLTVLSKTHQYTPVQAAPADDDEEYEMGMTGPSSEGGSSTFRGHHKVASFDQDTHDTASLEEFKKQQQSTTALYRAGHLMSQTQNLKYIALDLFLIFGTGFTLYLFLSWSIFW